MRIIVCGAGLVGSSIARQLASENNDVTIIDQSHETIRKMDETLDVRAIEAVDLLDELGGRADQAVGEPLLVVGVAGVNFNRKV